ncbi:MAG: hypothetical protein AAFN18_13405 [Cyanobacteria bacterium J06554_6]
MPNKRRQRPSTARLIFIMGISLTVSSIVTVNAIAPFAALAQSGTPGVVRNPSAPGSAWAVGHGEYCQQSTAVPGITEDDVLSVDVVDLRSSRSSGWLPTGTVFGPVQPSGAFEFWGANGSNVYRIKSTPANLELAPVDARDAEMRSPSGYWTMDEDGNVYVPDLRMREIVKLRSAQPFNPDTPVELIARSQLSANLFAPDDFIRGIKMLHAGPILVTLSNENVLVLDRNLVVIGRYVLAEGKVDNNPCVDERDNIFVTSGEALYKLRWTGEALRQIWRVDIDGSGSTPTLIGAPNDPDRLVAITDRNEPMNLVLFWRDDNIPADWVGLPGRDRRVAASLPVDFNVEGQTAQPTENSLLVSGYDIMLAAWTGLLPRTQRRQDQGISKVTWNPATNMLETAWINPAIWAPNSMQAMSAASNRAYIVGVEGSGRNREYGLHIIDWLTGENLDFIPIGPYRDARYNAYGSGLQIGPDGEIVIPGPLSVIRIRRQ